ncbi:DUF6228 family protein [Pseudoxanthomonas sp.]|uniref:DUF6228 family protein n=1 Tax=Pseudoxanthomonas sp. TaxID=1871049 RepID=UPI0035B44B6F
MEDSSFSIKSTTTDKELRFFGIGEYVFSVELRGTGIYAVREIYCPLGSSEFTQFFLRLASYERPWPDIEQCTSLEGDLSISARCSALGVVTFSISIHGLFGVPEEWQLSSDLTSELGQLPKIAAASSRFFGVVAGT